MNDEIFRLTPVDVRRMEFPKAMRGYEPSRVDAFRDQVAGELDRLTRANQDLDATVRSLTEQLRAFRDRDKALNDALVSAQQLRAEVRDQSERESQLVLREARSEAERIVQTAQMDAVRFADQIALLARMRRGYLKQFRVMLERQLAEIAVEEDVPDPDPSTIVGGDQDTNATDAPNPRSGALFRG
ncbi:MAG TPA: DivIVA domain-containing protein [Gemmatimonadaceae bacterium]|nr:DivIVA domain-containing protein [Gemmatimonadaceae bacterium]